MLKVVYNEKQRGSGRCTVLDCGIGYWQSRFFFLFGAHCINEPVQCALPIDMEIALIIRLYLAKISCWKADGKIKS
jgi:hypothetical protein